MIFGKKKEEPKQEPYSSLSRITCGDFTQLILSNTSPLEFSLFVNGREISPDALDSLTLEILAPELNDQPVFNGILSVLRDDAAGRREASARSLFPGMLEVSGLHRYLTVSAVEPHSFEGLWVSAGLDSTGRSNRLRGLSRLSFTLSGSILEGKIVWADGTSEELFPEADDGPPPIG